jgi:hypothetical protein
VSVLLMGRVFYTDLPAHLRLTLLAIADSADDDGDSIHIGQKHLGLRIGAGERTVRGNCRELVERGILIELGKTNRGVKRYRIDLATLPSDVDIEAQKATIRKVQPAATSAGDLPASPAAAAPAKSAGTKGHRKSTAARDRKPAAGEHRKSTAAYPSVEPSVDPSATTAALAARPHPPATIHRKGDGIFEALYRIWKGHDYPFATGDPRLTPRNHDTLGICAAELRKGGATAELVLRMPEAWVSVFPGKVMPTWTPWAAVKHWPALDAWLTDGYVARGERSNEMDEVAAGLADVEKRALAERDRKAALAEVAS